VRAALFCSTLAIAATAATAQVAQEARSVTGEGGPVSEISRDLQDSEPVHERGNNLGAGSVGSMNSGAVHDGPRRTMISGPVSEISRGPVTRRVSMTGDVAVRQASAGAVKEGIARDPVGEVVREAELQALQDHLRELRTARPANQEFGPSTEPDPADAVEDAQDAPAEEPPSP
jgi:hypothetical protein